MRTPELGSSVTCAETGHPFIVARDGCSFNYATTQDGQILSDEGVHLREVRSMLDRSRPFTCYISTDSRQVTGWKGNTLGHIVARSSVRVMRYSYIHGRTMLAIRVRDLHGREWYGRGSPGVCVTLRATKGG